MTNVRLFVCPDHRALSWEEFCASHGPFSVALDGYVAAGPRFDPTGPRINLDHHAEVDRLATRAACAQAFMAICQGLFLCFRDGGGPRADVYVNDCDEDVCTAWFLLQQGGLTDCLRSPELTQLVSLVDVLDTTVGAYPFPPDLPILEHLAWVFDPYRRFRLGGELDRRRPEEFAAVVEAVGQRILRHISGRGGRQPLDTRYERIGGGPCWALIREVGAQARTGVFADGIHAYVAVRPRPDGRWCYSVGRMSAFIPFDVPAILRALNEAEGAAGDCWGGSNTIGGSPRVAGSRLPPAEVERLINGLVGQDPRQPG